ncbi:MAG: hypothetical protein AAFQ81_18840 [Pseudomonadota bacterium]
MTHPADGKMGALSTGSWLPLTPRLAVAMVFAVGALALAPVAKAGAASMFERADANGDGRVTLAEAAAFNAARDARVDLNGDGRISLAEAEAAATARALEKARIAFARRDIDGDGFIDASERAARDVQRFSRLDLNGDGSVTRREARTALRAFAKPAR